MSKDRPPGVIGIENDVIFGIRQVFVPLQIVFLGVNKPRKSNIVPSCSSSGSSGRDFAALRRSVYPP